MFVSYAAKNTCPQFYGENIVMLVQWKIWITSDLIPLQLFIRHITNAFPVPRCKIGKYGLGW